jgi:hypothetical protein
LLAKHFRCIVDEFKISKMCSFCLEGETCYYKQRENPRLFREWVTNKENQIHKFQNGLGNNLLEKLENMN